MRPVLTAIAKTRDDGRIEVRSPTVGLWREAPEEGALLRPGMKCGAIEVLGVLSDLIVPEGATGVVMERDGGGGARPDKKARRSVAHGEVLVLLDRETAGQLAKLDVERAQHRVSGLLFTAPTSGRFYGRPSPDKPPFVSQGDELGPGQTICLLEVMKTFNRITYGGGGHPERARIARVFPKDGDDLSAGDPILELAPI